MEEKMTKKERSLVGTLAMIMVFLLAPIFTSCYSKNRLANTTWENDKGSTIIFGENSFTVESADNPIIVTGTYSISGDAIVLEYKLLAASRANGSLIGNTLTVFNSNYKRVK
jgi:hypothetical protein